MLDLSTYPKQVRLSDDQEVVVRVLEPGDEAELARFMKGLPPEERVYFRDDVTDPAVIHEWVHSSNLNKVIPLVALHQENIIADWSMHLREYGWTRHLAGLRGIVHPDHRRKGLAALMVYELLSIAQKLEVERVVIDLVSPQKGLLTHFASLGFTVEAVLKDWAKDWGDRYNDVLILSMKLEPAWKKMEELIWEYGTHGG